MKWSARDVYKRQQFVRSSIEAVVHTLLEAIALVVLVVILFLQTWRASIIPVSYTPLAVYKRQPRRCAGWRLTPTR